MFIMYNKKGDMRMGLICPNCTGKIEREKPLDLYVSCNKCGNEWWIAPRFSKFEYIKMIQAEIGKSSKKDIFQEYKIDIDELIEDVLKYDFYTQDIYYRLCKVTGRTMQNIQEYILIKAEDYDVYKGKYLKRDEKAKELLESN